MDKKEKIKIWECERKKDIKFPKAMENLEDYPLTIKSLEDINAQEGDDLHSIAIPGGIRAMTGLDVQGNAIKDLINDRLNTQTKQILGDFTFGVMGAIKIITDENNGVWISPIGIFGKKAGVTTFALTNTGDATFSGTITASNIIGGTITGGTITGSFIRTAASGTRIELQTTGTYANNLLLYSGANIVGWLWPTSNTLVIENPQNASILFKVGGVQCVEFYPAYAAMSDIQSTAHYPTSTNSYDLGSSTRRWRHLYLNTVGYVNAAGTAGTPFPSGWSVSRIATGRYRVTHNFGSTGYVVIATARASTVKVCSIEARNANNFIVRICRTGWVLQNNDFMFIVIRA